MRGIIPSKILVGLAFLMLFVGYGWAQSGGDLAALNAFKASADPGHVLDSKWNASKTGYCRWDGVKECMNGSVTKLVLEYSQLNGTFAEKTLDRLDQLRVLSLKGNGLKGTIPDLSGLRNLKILFLDYNGFTGPFPESITNLRRLTVLVLSDNQLSGQIPVSLTSVQRLYVFRVENNGFNGSIPALNQSGIGFVNFSNNKFSGPIPRTMALSKFNSSSFLGNPGLCGAPLSRACGLGFSPASAPGPKVPKLPEGYGFFETKSKKLSAGQISGIVVGSVFGFAALLMGFFFMVFRRKQKNKDENEDKGEARSDERSVKSNDPPDRKNGMLMFCGGETQMYTLEDLLRASAEILGRGTVGTTYKAVMEAGLIVTVKRLKNSSAMSREEFERHMEVVGKLRHPNIISLRAYFQAKEERLMVYDYQPNGSLFSLIHGSRSTGGKPLHWTSCLKIAEDVANGLAYLHQASKLIHGNLKSSNVLVGRDFEACITDFGLTVFDTEQSEDPSLLGYKAPECKSIKKMGPKADVYSFGVLILELLTGKTPLPSFLNGPATDLPRWVRSVRQEEMDQGAAFDDSFCTNEGSEDKLVVLLNISMSCVSLSPDQRPTMREVLRMIEEIKDAQISSDQSPRWSDAVHSLPRDNSSERSFTERD